MSNVLQCSCYSLALILRVPTHLSYELFFLSSILPHARDDISYEETVYGDLKDLPFEELPVKEDFLFDTRCEYSFELYLQLTTVLSLYSYSHLSYCQT